MRTIVLYILLIATMLPTVSPWGIIALYQLNKNYIARVLCENRDKPQLHCDGQCYLAKQLKAQQDKQDKETTERVQNLPSMQLFYQLTLPFLFNPVWILHVLAEFSLYRLPTYLAPLMGLFHPPQV
jgi:hypothetical protein